MKGLPGFRTLPAADRRRLEEAAAVLEVDRGTRIFRAGEPSANVWAVLQGMVHIVRTDPDGREMVVEVIPPGELFGAVVALDDEPYPATAVAAAPSLLWRAPSPVVRELALRHPALRGAVLDHASSRLRRAHVRLQSLALEPVEQRLARTLLMLGDRVGVERDGQTVVVVTRRELAEMAGTTVETAIRVTGAFRRAGMIRTSRNQVTLTDRPALQAITAGTPSRT